MRIASMCLHGSQIRPGNGCELSHRPLGKGVVRTWPDCDAEHDSTWLVIGTR